MKNKFASKNIFCCIAVVAVVVCVAAVLLFVHPADASSAGTELSSVNLSSRMEVFSNNVAGTALSDLTYIHVPKIYVLDDDALCGNTPNPACSGKTKDPAVVRAVIDSAAELLDGQELYWNEDLPFYQVEDISWYLDDTILVINWAEKKAGCPLYYYSEVKIAHASQFRRMLTDNTFGSSHEYYCTEMAKKAKAVLASNGDFYLHRRAGINVYNGKLYRCENGLDSCFIDGKGNLLVKTADETMTEAEAQAFIEENKVSFSLSFGPVLVRDGQLLEVPDYPIGELTHECIRSALGQLGKLHYVVLFSTRTPIERIGPKMQEMGCYTAYALDGGQTAETVFLGRPQSPWFFGAQRQVSDIFYFATAYPEGETK